MPFPEVAAPAGPMVFAPPATQQEWPSPSDPTPGEPAVAWPPPPPPAGGSAPPAVPTPRPDRAPTVVLAASVAVVLALVAGAVYIVTAGGRTFPSEWDERVAPLAAWTARARNLPFEHPVEVHFLSEEEFVADVTGSDLVLDEEDQAAADAETADTVGTLRALGFVDGEVDLSEATDSLMGAGTLAYYSPSTKEVFVRGTEVTPAVRATLVHELVHVLQDQHFDLERLSELGEHGRATTLRALAEGDAGRIEDEYKETFTDEDWAAYEDEMASVSEGYAEQIDDEVPEILEILFAAPYVFGPSLIWYLDETGGDAAIDAALTDPPTEFVLFDPPLFGTDRAQPLETEVTPPPETEVISEDTFGAAWWYLLLATRIPPPDALAAVNGIGGDAYVSYRDDEAVCVRIAASAHADSEAAALTGALDAWAAFTSASATVTRDGNRVMLQSCDDGRDEPVGATTMDLLVLPVVRTQTHVQILSEGGEEDEARCLSEGLVQNFTVEELTAEDPFADPATQGRLLSLQAAC